MAYALFGIWFVLYWLGRVPDSHWTGLWGRTREREWVVS
jgi:hypothetical protein